MILPVVALLLAPRADSVAGLAPVLIAAQNPSRACAAPSTSAPLAPELSEPGQLYRGTLIEGGNAMLYFKRLGRTGENYRMFRSDRRGSQWSPPEQLRLGGDFSDLYPTLSVDGTRLVFSSYRPLPGADSSRHNAHLWAAARRGKGWSVPTALTAANRPGLYHPGPSFMPDGSVRFTLVDQTARTSTKMITAPLPSADGGFGPARAASDPPRWRSTQPDSAFYGATLSPDGRLAIVGVSRIDPATRMSNPLDAMFSRLVNGAWTPLQPLEGGVNTAADENFFTFSPDGCALVFTRDYTSFHIISVAAATEQARRDLDSVSQRQPAGKGLPAIPRLTR